MASSAFDVLSRASKEIGYSRWTDPGRGTKYGNWYAKLTKSPYFGENGVPFCAMGVSFVLSECGVDVPGFPSASCSVILSASKRVGNIIGNKRDAQPGDIVLFDWDGWAKNGPEHVGFVEKNCGAYIQTIEFNTSSGASGSQGNGGGVYRRTRSWSTVHSVIRPSYGAQTATKPVPNGLLAVDGLWGTNSNLRLQIVVNAPYKDGIISRQNADHRWRFSACTSGWDWVPGGEEPGSQALAKLMRIIGSHPDGIAGPNFANDLIKYFMERGSGATVLDRRLDAPSITVKALQRWLNAQ